MTESIETRTSSSRLAAPVRRALRESALLLFGLVIVIFQKVILGDQARFITHGGRAFRADARPSKLAIAGIVTYSFIATVLPLSALVIVSLSSFWSADIDWGGLTLDNFRQVFDESNITGAVSTSLVCSLGAVLIALPIGFFAASLILKGRKYKIMRPVAEFIITMPLGIPAVVFGVGFLLTYTQEPFFLYGTRWVIILVYVTLMLPFTTRMQLGGMIALGNTYQEAARASGAGNPNSA